MVEDRRKAYERRQREAGLVKISCYVPRDAVPHVHFLAKVLCATNGRYLADLVALTETWDKGHE